MRAASALAIAAFLVTACMTVTHGVNPQTAGLAQLKPGESKSADVLLNLGEPRGKGTAHLSPEFPARDIWFYEYVKSDGHTVNLKMLIVFMNGDVYDGYLWFSSLDKFQKTYAGVAH